MLLSVNSNEKAFLYTGSQKSCAIGWTPVRGVIPAKAGIREFKQR